MTDTVALPQSKVLEIPAEVIVTDTVFVPEVAYDFGT